MQSRTGYDDTYITNTNLEYLIDDAINYVNLEAGTSISNLSGVAGSKTVTVTAAQGAVVIPLITLCMRAYKDKGPSSSTQGLSVTAIVSDPQYKLEMMMLKSGIRKLCGSGFERV